jgi:hypothetical protein
MHTFLHYCLDLIMMSLCFEHPSVHPQEDRQNKYITSLSEVEHLDVGNMTKTL